MAVGFLPKVQECCGDIPLECAIFAILIWDLFRSGISTWEVFTPICTNYSRSEGFGLFMRVFAGVVMAIAILRVVCLVVVILGFFLEKFNATIAVYVYVFSTFVIILLTLIYYSLYFLLLKKSRNKCNNVYISEVSKKIPDPEDMIDETMLSNKEPRKLKSYAWVPTVFLIFFFLESFLLVYFAIVVNSFGDNFEDNIIDD